MTYVRLPHDHLRFTRPLPAGWRVLDSGALTAESVGGLGRRVAAFGTVYFIGLVLDLVDSKHRAALRVITCAVRAPGASGA